MLSAAPCEGDSSCGVFFRSW